MPPSSRGEGLLFLPGLESNHESSLKSEEELDSLEATQGAPRYQRHDSGGERSLCFPSRRGLTPRGSMGCNPEILVFPGEEHEVLDKRLDEVSLALQ